MVAATKKSKKVTRAKKTCSQRTQRTERLLKKARKMTRTTKRSARKARRAQRPPRTACSRKMARMVKARAAKANRTSSVPATPSKSFVDESLGPLPTIPRSNNWSFFPTESKEASTPETEKRNPRKRKFEDDLLSPIRFYKKAYQRSPSPAPGTPPKCKAGEYTFIADPTSPGDALEPMIPKAARVKGFRRTKSGILEASAVLDITSFLNMSGVPDTGLKDISETQEITGTENADFTKTKDPSIRIKF